MIKDKDFKPGVKLKLLKAIGDKTYPKVGEIVEVSCVRSNRVYFKGYSDIPPNEVGIYLDQRSNAWFEIVEDNDMLKPEDIKEGDVLIGLETKVVHLLSIVKDQEYLVSKFNDKLCYKEGLYGCYYFEPAMGCTMQKGLDRLANFKLKKETTMLDPEIYAVGTVHKSINARNYYAIVTRDIEYAPNENPVMLVRNINTRNLSIRDQVTGKHPSNNSNSGTDLAITKKKIKGWIAVGGKLSTFKNAASHICTTKEQAIAQVSSLADGCIACIEVEFEEGEGL